MNQLLRSFAAGVGSIMSIYPQPKADEARRDVIQAIGDDFARIGKDITRATLAEKIVSGSKEISSHGEGKAVQLDLIPS